MNDPTIPAPAAPAATAVQQRRRTLVICPFPEGVAAGQRLKYEQYFDDWRAAGWDIDVSSFMDMNMWRVAYEFGNIPEKVAGTLKGHGRRLRDLGRVGRYDLVYVFMWVTPFGTSAMERLVRWMAPRLIYDLEDNRLVGQKLPRSFNPNAVAAWLKGTGKTRYLIREADHVITSSPFLAETCLALNRRRRATYITSSVDTERFVPANRYANDGPVTIGWTGTFSSRVYLDMLREVFQELARRVRYRLRVIGNFDYELPDVDLEVVRWTAEREVEDLQAIDIGVYPLPDDPWVFGKSGLKAIQYMAFGLPVVASHAGHTPEVVKDGETGILVRSPAQWIDALERLVRDPDLRRRMGQAGRRTAEAKYSRHVVRGQYRAVIDSVFEDNN
jgi:glycosyltransferase involved in cell wall biosynthesis